MAKQYVAKTPNGFSMKVTQMLFVPQRQVATGACLLSRAPTSSPPALAACTPTRPFLLYPATQYTHIWQGMKQGTCRCTTIYVNSETLQ